MSGRPAGGGPVPDAPPPPGVVVRPARPRDRRQIVDLIATVAAERRYIRTEEVDSARSRKQKEWARRSWTVDRANLVAVADGRVVGNLGMAREDGAVSRHVASLGMAVAPEWRGRGLGSALLAEAFRWAEWAGVEKVLLTVYPHNDRAINLYRKFGFVEEGRLSGHSKKSYGYEDEIVMGRWL
jgi:L-phenylalanine/L-methionine N-acetyltransferase